MTSRRKVAIIIVSLVLLLSAAGVADAMYESPREDCEKRGGIYLEQTVGNRCFVNGQGFY